MKTLIALFSVPLLITGTALACPFCSAPTLTLTEQYAKADAAVLVQWAGGEKPEKDLAGNTVFEVVQVLRDPAKNLEKGKRITLERYRAGKKGDLSLLMGSKGEVLEWGSPLEVTETAFNYVVQAPPPESSPQVRLAYFMKFLEYSDQTISNDAYAEFANAPYKDIVPLATNMPREKLRQWVVSPDVPESRLGLYGLMLGLCGVPEDAAIMEKKIVQPVEDFRLGIDGVIGGYLLLTGEKGLTLVEDVKFKDKKVPFSETYSALQALRFMWSYGDGRIKPERLRESMRLLLDRPELTDLVIADLARWKDWSIQKRLMDMYGKEEFNVPSIKRAVIKFMIASSKDVPMGDAGKNLPQHATDGSAYLKTLREKDPKLVQEVERFYFP